MNKNINSILLIALFASVNLFGADKEGSESVITSNIGYTEGYLLKKIKKEESRVNKYHERLRNLNNEDGKVWLKKIKSSEKKLKKFHEALSGIDLIKPTIAS